MLSVTTILVVGRSQHSVAGLSDDRQGRIPAQRSPHVIEKEALGVSP